MSGEFKTYPRNHLDYAERKALAEALTTIYTEGMGSSPPNPLWDDNVCSVRYIGGEWSSTVINAFEGSILFSVNTNKQAVTWKRETPLMHASDVTPVPKPFQDFVHQLANKVHGVGGKRTEALNLKRKREEETQEEEKNYYEAKKEKIDTDPLVALERELEGADAAAQEAIKKVIYECETVNQNHKMGMEEHLLLSDDELNKSLEKLNADVNVEIERVDENFKRLLLQKRHLMQVEKKMKDMQAVHTEHVDLIDKLRLEIAELKKMADSEKKVVTLIDEKTQDLVHVRKDQETKTTVKDFKIQEVGRLGSLSVCHPESVPCEDYTQ